MEDVTRLPAKPGDEVAFKIRGSRYRGVFMKQRGTTIDIEVNGFTVSVAVHDVTVLKDRS